MKTKDIKPITPAQIKALHAILNKYGLMEYKHEFINELTGGRTESARELTSEEAIIFFSRYNKQSDGSVNEESSKTTVHAIWKLAWKMGIIYGDSQEDYEMNRAKLNLFCKERGTVKKNLTQMNLIELRKTHKQFEAMFSKFTNKHK